MTQVGREPEIQQEPDLLPGRAILLVFGGALAFGLLCCVVGFLLTRDALHTFRPSGRFPERDLGAPHEVSLVEEIVFGQYLGLGQQIWAEDRALLESYGWVDRSRGLVRIPIQQAMAIVAGEGR